DSRIAERLQDFFARETAWLEETLEEYAAIEGEADFDIDALFEAVARRSEPARAFEREYVALKREWDAAALNDRERAAVEASAERTAGLVKDVQGLIDRALARC